MPTRKIDRRTQYTINVIKEAFLELINDRPLFPDYGCPGLPPSRSHPVYLLPAF